VETGSLRRPAPPSFFILRGAEVLTTIRRGENRVRKRGRLSGRGLFEMDSETQTVIPGRA
jgi:hypothetical protein